MFGTISDAHFNAVVTLSEAGQSNLPGREVQPYIVIQVVDAFAGVAAAHGMFGEPQFFASEHARTGAAQWWSECVTSRSSPCWRCWDDSMYNLDDISFVAAPSAHRTMNRCSSVLRNRRSKPTMPMRPRTLLVRFTP